MIRPLTLLTALALAAPMPALAQTFPASATVALGVHSIPVQPRMLTLNETTAAYARAAPQPVAAQPLKLKAHAARDEVPAVEVQAKDAWFDDQGFRATPTRVSYKQRF